MRYRYNPQCSCGRCRAHGLMGPAVLISLGVLFLLDQLTNVRWLDFDRTWPAFLIVIGLVMFLQHNASMDGHVPRLYGAGPPAWQSQAQQYGAPQPPAATPPPAPPTSPLAGGTDWNRSDDQGGRNG